MALSYKCGNETRKSLLRDPKVNDRTPPLNGIDYLEVDAENKTITINFIYDLQQVGPGIPPVLSEDNIIIQGGARVKDIGVKDIVEIAGRRLTLTLDTWGDYSRYSMRLVASKENQEPPDGFDLILSYVEFSFMAERSKEFDCLIKHDCPKEAVSEPEIDYLAKDYASFRQLMLDRLSVLMPGWQRNPADLQMALVELLAYVGDHLSYYQDAVATEAYLGTARKRISMHRHARLLNYPMHDGCNARAWVAIQVDADGIKLPGPDTENNQPGSILLTRVAGEGAAIPPEMLAALLDQGAMAFETMHDITLYKLHNPIKFYTWGEEDCCLPKGATSATLCGHLKNLGEGNVLIFVEVLGPASGVPKDADPSHRQAVRLTKVKVLDSDGDRLRDPLTKEEITEVSWDEEDALTFPLCVSVCVDGNGEKQPVSIALGNVVLVDHGRTFPRSELGEAEETLGPVGQANRYRPSLRSYPITQQGQVRSIEGGREVLVPLNPAASAKAAMAWDRLHVRPAVKLLDEGFKSQPWLPVRDLLESVGSAREFVVEVEDDGNTRLRFGDDILGRRPEEGDVLRAIYRIGNGRAGNVGRESIAHIVISNPGIISNILNVSNPMPAIGGLDPEGRDEVRLYAPEAFNRQERAITETDYAEIAQRHPGIQKAAATLRWTGSWHTAFVTIDRMGGLPVDSRFKEEIRAYLERYRMAGVDLEIEGPVFVPLEILMKVTVKPEYFKSDVKESLFSRFVTGSPLTGRLGFFHPDNFTFGTPVYLSRLYRAAMDVEGVSHLDIMVKFRRWGAIKSEELKGDLLEVGTLEVVRLDNDPNYPENGTIEFQMEGGI